MRSQTLICPGVSAGALGAAAATAMVLDGVLTTGGGGPYI